MIVGADVTHPGKGISCPSMAAVVATSDDHSFHYLASARLQAGKEEACHKGFCYFPFADHTKQWRSISPTSEE